MALFESHPDRLLLMTQNIANSWSQLIPEAAGHGEKFLDEVERHANELILDVKATRQELEVMKEGERSKGLYVRPCLFVRGNAAPTNEYTFYFSTQDFGKHLILSRFTAAGSKTARSPFDMEVLSAYFSLVNAATQGAAKQIATDANQDFSKINTRSEGIIDIV
jgi:hypothetical protein